MWSGCQGILDNHFSLQFTFFEYIAYMKTHILLSCLKQFHHLCLRKPHRILLYLHMKRDTLVGLVEDYLGVFHYRS